MDQSERATLLERVRTERDKAEERATDAERIIVALVVKLGEQVHRDEAWRAALTDEDLTGLPDARLRIMRDPNSGAMLIRVERPL